MPERPSPDEISRAVDLRDGVRALQRVAHYLKRSQNSSIDKLFSILSEVDSNEIEHKAPEVQALLASALEYLEEEE